MSKSVRGNFLYNIILTIGQLIIPLISFPYLTRILKPDGIGLISFVDSIVMYLVLVASLGIPIYGVREVAKCRTKEEKSKLFSEVFSLHVIAMMIGLAAYAIIVFSFTKTSNNLAYFALGTISYIAGNLTFEWFFQGSEDYKFITIRTLLVRLVVLVAIFILVKNQSDLLLYYMILNAGLLINTIINVVYLSKHVTFSFSPLANIKKHLRPVFSLFATRFATSIYVVLLSALIGFLATDSAVGFFSAAYKVYFVSLTAVLAYNTVIIPRMTQSYRDKDEAAMNHYVGTAYHFIMDFAVPFALFVLVNADAVIHLIAGSEYTPSILDLQILAPLIFIIAFSNVFAMNILTPMGNDKFFLYSVTAGMVLSLFINIPLIMYYQDMGASVGLFFTELCICCILGFYVKKTWHLDLNISRLLICLLSVVPFYVARLLTKKLLPDFVVSLACNAAVCILYWLFMQLIILKNTSYFTWIRQGAFRLGNVKSGKSS